MSRCGAAFVLSLPAAGRAALVVLTLSLFGFGLVVGSSVVIDENEVGIVHKQFFGKPLPTGQIIARNGEMGPQAEILGPGWHFGYYPFTYQVRVDRVVSVPSGQVGFVTARDGQPLPENEMFAPAWDSAQEHAQSHDLPRQGRPARPADHHSHVRHLSL